AGGDADRNAFEARDEARIGDGLLVRNGDDLVIDGGVEDFRGETRAQPLNLVRTGLSAGQDGRCRRFDGDDLHGRLAGLQHLPDAGDGATGADAGNDDVDA